MDVIACMKTVADGLNVAERLASERNALSTYRARPEYPR